METKVYYSQEGQALGTVSNHQKTLCYQGDYYANELHDLPADCDPTGLSHQQVETIARGYSRYKQKLLMAGFPMEQAETVTTYRSAVINAASKQLGWGIGTIASKLESESRYTPWTWASTVSTGTTIEAEAAQIVNLLESLV